MTNLENHQRVVIYARVSTEEQREGQTIDSQVRELERFANEKSWEIAGVYKDEGWSGSLLGRPELDRLRDDAAQKLFQIALVNDVDRLARDVTHLGVIKRDLERYGVQTVFRKLPTEQSPTQNLMVNILGSFAEFEREMIADRTRRGRRHKVEVRQLFLGCQAAYGYRYIPKDHAAGKEGYLQVIPEEAAVVKQMYLWVGREGMSAHEVVRRLNDTSIRPRKGGRWAKSTVIRILRSETYVGVWHYNKHYSCEPERPLRSLKYRRPKSSTRLRSRLEWLPVKLPAHLQIIDRNEWGQVQKQLTRNIAFSPRNSKHSYLLSGLVRCGGCGSMYVGDPNHGRFYYRCHKRCKGVPIVRQELLDETVWSAVKEAILDPSIIADQLAQLRQREGFNKQRNVIEGDQLNRASRVLQQEESRILDAYREGVISPAQLGKELEKLQIRKASLELRERDVTKHTKPSSELELRGSVVEFCQQVENRINTFTNEERQRFLRVLIDRIVFDGERVRIKAVLPIQAVPESYSIKSGDQLPSVSGSNQESRVIADSTVSTASRHSGHNSVVDHGIEFDLVTAIIRKPRTRRKRNSLGQFISLGQEQRKEEKLTA
jgi:site-specific DNA recombinase